LPMIHLQ